MKRLARVLAAAGALLVLACAAQVAVDHRRSGFEDMSPATQAMQRDDSMNPAMLFVQEGEPLWRRAPSASARSCAACHGEPASMRGVALRYPAWDETLRRPVNLGTRINLCRERHQGQPPWPAEHADLLALEGFVAMQSRGLPIAPSTDARLAPFLARGEALYRERMGQLDLSCAQCHDERAGGKLGAALIPQGQATGYPIYRLEWQAMGSLGRRLRGCMGGVRAEPFASNSVEMAELELVLAQRALGMKLETPAVRP
ncbi:sulfur oxidation c-type cytochrome SoxA [Ramlibacter sp.]|uniref:sulfur oxidation c-type cytochrome SoxA n=1 Tax=Ramlibacter sp. TaxID=1917967 RepID=UPI00260B7D45|nr:sulfur oxidation c-type cytochrome SoxA [Ramlibacter sp.]MDB5958404.1 sulfur oxidation c-type cytochrome SoxA [Ramlibacter sp.]